MSDAEEWFAHFLLAAATDTVRRSIIESFDNDIFRDLSIQAGVSFEPSDTSYGNVAVVATYYLSNALRAGTRQAVPDEGRDTSVEPG